MNNNIFGVEFGDELVRIVARFLERHINTKNIEFEGKLGLIWNNLSSSRLSLGIKSSALIDSQLHKYYFHSSLSSSMFSRLKQLFDNRMQHNDSCSSSVTFSHIINTDSFFDTQNQNLKSKIRVTKNTHGTKCIEKTRLENLDIHMPAAGCDIRISASIEKPLLETNIPKTPANYTRKKNRYSYSFKNFDYDLTEASLIRDNASEETSFEAEVEFNDEGINFLKSKPLEAATIFLEALKTLAFYSTNPNHTPILCKDTHENPKKVKYK